MVPTTAASRSAVRRRDRWERMVFVADAGGSSQSSRSSSSRLTLPGARSARTVRSSRVLRSNLTATPSAPTIDAAPRTQTLTRTNLRPQPDHIPTTSRPGRRYETIRNMTTTHEPDHTALVAGLNHVAILTPDLDRIADFYTHAFGATRCRRAGPARCGGRRDRASPRRARSAGFAIRPFGTCMLRPRSRAISPTFARIEPWYDLRTAHRSRVSHVPGR